MVDHDRSFTLPENSQKFYLRVRVVLLKFVTHWDRKKKHHCHNFLLLFVSVVLTDSTHVSRSDLKRQWHQERKCGKNGSRDWMVCISAF